MSRMINTDRCSKRYERSYSFFINFFNRISISSFICHFISLFFSENSYFLSSLKDFQFNYPLFTIENAF